MRRPLRPLSERRPKRTQISAEQLASLSHELRTPLNGVLGLSRLLEGTRLTAEQRAYAVALRESGQHMLTLVNDLLDFAKLGAGGVELSVDTVDVAVLLRSVCELLSPRAAEKGVEVGWAAPRDLRVRADEARLKQILFNLAGNGVKFTTEGGVFVGAELRPDGRLRLTVEDTGPGVSQVDQERIFEAFTQAGDPDAQIGGSGLGLAIARRLAHAMQGELGVEDARGGGALFWFEADFPQLSPKAELPPLAGRTVGIATTNAIVARAAVAQIDAAGARPVHARDVETLLAATTADDVLLIDHALASAGSTLRAPPGRKAIVLLAANERARKDASRQAGFSGYLIKPLRQDSLAERVLIATGAKAESAETREDERIAAAAAPGARVLLVEDNPINALLARALLTREGCVVDHAAGGEEARAAVKVGAYDLILMDMRMPGMSGIETARHLRAGGVTTPIVALTANAFEDDRQACLAAGMDDFLVKPLLPDALRAVLTRWTGRDWTDQPARAKVG